MAQHTVLGDCAGAGEGAGAIAGALQGAGDVAGAFQGAEDGAGAVACVEDGVGARDGVRDGVGHGATEGYQSRRSQGQVPPGRGIKVTLPIPPPFFRPKGATD